MKIQNRTELQKLYGMPKGRTVKKELRELEHHCKKFISLSPFLVLATNNTTGEADASPRGGEQGFVKIIDNKTLLIPDAKGNKRLDSLLNIVENPNVGLLFFIPGVDETLRVNGKASLHTDSELLEYFDHLANKPLTVTKVVIDQAFLHCAKSLMRSKLWSSDYHIDRSTLPTMGQMIKDQIGEKADPESQEEMIARYQDDL